MLLLELLCSACSLSIFFLSLSLFSSFFSLLSTRGEYCSGRHWQQVPRAASPAAVRGLQVPEQRGEELHSSAWAASPRAAWGRVLQQRMGCKSQSSVEKSPAAVRGIAASEQRGEEPRSSMWAASPRAAWGRAPQQCVGCEPQ
eukprot:g21588.t1